MLKKLAVIFSIIFLFSCSSIHDVKPQAQEDESMRTNRSVVYDKVIDSNLANLYEEWKGTRYRFGGASKKGIDCSAFTQTVFLDSFGITLPRATRGQKHVGIKISKSDLKKGDLVFFRNNRHVGIYMGNQQFMHSSSSRGVTISSLDEAYWKRNYTQSRRVL